MTHLAPPPFAIAGLDPFLRLPYIEVISQQPTAVPRGSAVLVNGFIALTVVLALGILLNVYLAGRGLRESVSRTWLFTGVAAVGLAVWMGLTWQLAASGVLAEFDRWPPPMMLLLLAVLTVSTIVAFTRYGTRFVNGLPLWLLIVGQSFRLPLELLMHQAANEGVMPMQMSYSGWNFDIVTGTTAIPVAWWLARGHAHARTLALIWNVMGSLLLANVLTVAALSLPTFARFGPDRLNVWVTEPPYVWLPTMMVVTAITGHLVIFRKLRATATRRL